jgi:hypothetical protein
MTAAFDVFVIAAVADVIYQVGKEMWDLTEAMNGFDAASIKAWDDARRGVISTREELLRHDLKHLEATFESQKGSDKSEYKRLEEESDRAQIARIQRDQKSTQDDLRAMQDIIGMYQKIRDFNEATFEHQKQIGLHPKDILEFQMRMYQTGMNEEKAKQSAKDDLNALTSVGNELDDKNLKLQRDITKELTVHKEAMRREHDPVHELPYRLPWFMGVSPASAFAAQMKGVIGGPSQMESNPAGMPSVNQALPTLGSNANASSHISGTPSKASASIVVNETFAPVYNFEGIPADVDKFMREKAEPRLVKDMQTNARGITENIVQTLRKAGM